MPRETVKSEWEMQCPKCKADDQIDIAATMYVRLLPDGTDPYESGQGDTEWDDKSHAICRACDYSGKVSKFKIKD